MKTLAPEYYNNFKCIADKCNHTCCVGWEIDIDEISLERFKKCDDIIPFIDFSESPHFALQKGERCPFLKKNGLCNMIIDHGEDMLCDICRDHPRFRNFFTGRTEIGLGLVCIAAAKLVLSSKTPLNLIVIEDDGDNEALPEDEIFLLSKREEMLNSISETGPKARLLEYLIFRHLADALYDDRLDERIRFIYNSFSEISKMFDKTDGSIDQMAECVVKWSYDVEYDDEELEKRLCGNN